jgi:hypothetical protein
MKKLILVTAFFLIILFDASATWAHARDMAHKVASNSKANVHQSVSNTQVIHVRRRPRRRPHQRRMQMQLQQAHLHEQQLKKQQPKREQKAEKQVEKGNQ